MEQIWKNIKNYKGFYEISPIGDVKSLERKDSYGSGRLKDERILINCTTDGYHRVWLSKYGKKECVCVHRLVATAFIPNPENKPFVNHKNGVRNDNRVENLEWCTHSENLKHAYRELGVINPQKGKFGKEHNCYGKGNRIHPPKKVHCDTLDISFDSANDAARLLGVTQGHLSSVCRGERRHTNGLTFRYITT